MEKVYLLQHTHQINEDYEDIKTLGIFTTYEKAYEAIQEYLELPGFKDSPDGFCIDSYELNEKCWREGFTTV